MTTYIVTGRLGYNRASNTLRGAIPANQIDAIIRPRYRVAKKIYPDRTAAERQKRKLQATFRRKYEIQIVKRSPDLIAKWKARLQQASGSYRLTPKFKQKGKVDFYTFGPDNKQGIKISKPRRK
jgi:hypothetical protein